MVSKKEFISAKKTVVQYWKENIKERGVSTKMLETELYVDTYIKETGNPPTYRQVVEEFKLKSTSAAYFRLRRYRNIMASSKKI